MTSEQRKLFRSQYTGLRDEDEPPYPESGMEEVSRQVSKIQHILRVEGLLIFTIHVNATGEGVSAKIYKTPDAEASRAVAFAAMNIKYKPAKCAGVPCEMDFPYRIRFILQ